MADEKTMQAVREQRARVANCTHNWIRDGYYKSPPTVIYRCTKCGDLDEKDVS